MKQITLVNIYNFIRMSHQEPSVFIQDDFDTVACQLALLRQYGLPSTFALKYDALMDSRYQKLLLEFADENDEIGAWWEITEPLCRRAGVSFVKKEGEVFDDRVDSAYSIGYSPADRRKLLDAYMADFHAIFGYYPKTIGSWILDSVTLSHAHDQYGTIGAAICRDQMGTDGFTLWGGYPNGIYYPSRQNEYLPAQTAEDQLPVAMFRLLSPDPLCSFEQDVREGLSGVYTLEPCCQNGRDPERISWFFSSLTKEDGAGIGYAQVGQENNFLWENIRPGFAPQLTHLCTLLKQGKIRVETMAESAAWFQRKYALTPPLTWQASGGWGDFADIGCQWYASRFYRIGFLYEERHLRIRDFFFYHAAYASRYLTKKLADTPEIRSQPEGRSSACSTMDALPLLFPGKWMADEAAADNSPVRRPFIRLLEPDGSFANSRDEYPAQSIGSIDVSDIGTEPSGACHFFAPDAYSACAVLRTACCEYRFTMSQDCLLVEKTPASCRPKPLSGPAGREDCFSLCFDSLPVFRRVDGRTIWLEHNGFPYSFTVARGFLQNEGPRNLHILSEHGRIRLDFAGTAAKALSCGTELFTKEYLASPDEIDRWQPKSRFPARKPPAGPSAADSFLPPALSAMLSSPEKEYCACLHDLSLQSTTCFDCRPVFCPDGIRGLLNPLRGSLDYQDGRWLATREDLDFICLLPEERLLRTVGTGFLSHHRSGIVYPDFVELYLGADADSLTLFAVQQLPCGPAAREIARRDICFHPDVPARCLRFVAHRHRLMPQWCCYKGSPDVFLLADCLILN